MSDVEQPLSHPELVSGSQTVIDRFRNKFGMTSCDFPRPAGEGGRRPGEGAEKEILNHQVGAYNHVSTSSQRIVQPVQHDNFVYIKNHLPFTTHYSLVKRKAAARFIRGGEKAWFSATLRAGFATAHTAPYRKIGFTLAEVLITLGIIGVVAAMTLPTLTAKYRVSVVETSLKKFYTNINQAVKLSVVQNGETRYWQYAKVDTGAGIEEFFNKYFKDYLKILNSDKDEGYFYVYFSDGSGVRLDYYGRDWDYCINAKDVTNATNLWGSKCFRFGLYPDVNGWNHMQAFSYKNFYNKGVEPYVSTYTIDEEGNFNDTTVEDLSKNPANYTKIIQLNGWRIPKDYPIKL